MSTSVAPATLRIGVKNLEDGGLDQGGIDIRLRRQLKAAAGYGLHAFGVNEAKWGDDSDRTLRDAEELLGMTAYRVRSNHHGCDLVWFIRPDVGIHVKEALSDTAPPWWHGLNHLETEIDGFDEPLHLLLTHLAPSSPHIRLCEAETFGLFRKRQAILAGDMNARAVGEQPSTDGVDADRAEGKLDDRPARAIAAAGFTDIGAHTGDTTPTVGHTTPGHLAYRCDRIHTTLPPELIRQYQVVTDGPAEEGVPASNHRMALAVLARPGMVSR